MASTVVIESFESQVLRDNPLGDPHMRRIPVYLPPGYEAGGQRYPVAYVLSGYTGRGLSHLNDSAWEETLPERLDRLISQGTMRPMIVVMPDCFTRYGGSQYINSSATGRYEDHLIQELVPFLDAKYRTVPERDFRAVLGKSSGGYGAMVLGMRHPELFGLVADHSGDKYFDLCYRMDFGKCLDGLARFGGAKKFLDGFPHPHPRPHRSAWLDVIGTLAMAACYSPNSGSPLGFDLPFDEHTGELDERVWTRWLEQDPVHLVRRHAEALLSMRLLYLDCGTRDEFYIHYGTRIFVRRLQELGIAYFHEEFDDGHRNVQYRHDRSFALLSEALPR
jgi:enterochelin esterase family protein